MDQGRVFRFGFCYMPPKCQTTSLHYIFYKFKERLKHRCDLVNTKLHIVDESFTSKTCTRCGSLNNVGSSEVYECRVCELVIDRDVNGARNIFIKNVKFK